MSFLRRVSTSVAANKEKYSVHFELNENGSSDYLGEIVLPKKVVESLKGLKPQKLSALKKDLKAALVKAAQQS